MRICWRHGTRNPGGVQDPGGSVPVTQPGYIIAVWYLFAGDHNRAFGWLEKSFEVREPNLPYINFRPYFGPLRSNQRFQSLLRRMKLP